MSTTYFQLVVAREPLAEVNKLRLPIKKARKVFDKLTEVSKELEFYASEENKISEAYCKKDENGSVMWSADGQSPLFDEDTPDNEKAWTAEVRELQNREARISDRAIRITDRDIGTQPIASAWIDLLKGIIEFEEA